MNKQAARGIRVLLAVWLTGVACNISTVAPQAPAAPSLSQEDLAQTAAALVLTAQAGGSPSAGPQVQVTVSAEPAAVPTACQPLATATMNSNLRAGPGTDYEIVGSLMQGEFVTVAGQNQGGTWWYVDYSDGPGGHAWIAASVTTASCLPASVLVIAAPPLPVTDTPEVVAKPDLVITQFSISPSTPTMGQNAHVRIQTYNEGNAASGPYAVQWYGLSTFASPSCTWNVDNSNAHGGRVLECDFIFSSWYPVNKTSLAIVDANDDVDESHEGNNEAAISPFGVAQP